MVLPLVVAGAALAVSAIMQYYNSEKARGATQDRLDQIEAMFNKIVPPQFNLKVYDDPKLAGTLPTASYDFSKITPAEYKTVANIAPEAAPYVAEQNPALVQSSAAGEAGRQAQLQALEKYKSIASGQFDPEFYQQVMQAQRKAQQDASSQRASILENFQRRGMAGPGAELALEAQGTSGAMQQEALADEAASADAYRNRLSALASGAQLGGQINQQDFSQQATNANIINDYNQRTSKAYQQYLNNRANMVYDARVRQEDLKQRTADQNTGAANQFAQYNQQNYNNLQERAQNDEINRRNYYLALERQRQQAQQQGFANEMDVARGKAGIAGTQINYLRQNAQDRNQAIQGVGEAAAIGAYGYLSQPDQKPPAQPDGSAPMGNGTVQEYAPYSENSGTHWLDENQSREPGQGTGYRRPYTYDDYIGGQ